MSRTLPTIGFIGLGMMGLPMAARVQAAGLTPGQTVIDMSSISPTATVEFAQRFNEMGSRSAHSGSELRCQLLRRTAA